MKIIIIDSNTSVLQIGTVWILLKKKTKLSLLFYIVEKNKCDLIVMQTCTYQKDFLLALPKNILYKSSSQFNFYLHHQLMEDMLFAIGHISECHTRNIKPELLVILSSTRLICDDAFSQWDHLCAACSLLMCSTLLACMLHTWLLWFGLETTCSSSWQTMV